MEELIFKIQRSENLVESLDKLGDELRQDSSRIAIYDQLPKIIPEFNKVLLLQSSSSSTTSLVNLKLKILRILINILANNDINRDYLTNELDSYIIELWSIIKNQLNDGDEDYDGDVRKFIFILLNQFIYNTQHKDKYLEFLYNQNIQHELYSIINNENWNEIGEFIYELLSSLKQKKSTKDEEFINLCFDLKVKQQQQEEEDDDEDEDESIWVDLLGLNKPSNESFQKALKLIPNRKSSLIKRKLFVLACNLVNYENDDDYEKSLIYSIDNLNITNDSYVFSVYCIIIGNSIHDKSSFEKIEKLIELKLGIKNLQELYFNKYYNKIIDIIQLQSIHLWNNLLNKKSGEEIIKNYQNQLLAITKIIIDNGNYYKEILNLYYKFIKKLIKLLEFPPTKLIEFILDNDKASSSSSSVIEIKYLLLQLYPELYPELIEDVVKNVNTTNVLEQLKTLSIINNALISGKLTINDLQDEYLIPLGQILSQLSIQLDNHKGGKDNEELWEFKAFKNNLKYVSGTTISLLKETNTDILETCNHILQE